jgi:hypothetical protein
LLCRIKFCTPSLTLDFKAADLATFANVPGIRPISCKKSASRGGRITRDVDIDRYSRQGCLLWPNMLMNDQSCRCTLKRRPLVRPKPFVFASTRGSFARGSDWIEDSILERSRRLREAKKMYASSARTNDRYTLSWLVSHVRELLVSSQSWFVVSIVGEPNLSPPFSCLHKTHPSTHTTSKPCLRPLLRRCGHRNQRGDHLHRHGVAL